MQNNKVMVFSSFRHTLRYLYEKLSAQNIRVGIIHGGVKDEERIILRNRFKAQNVYFPTPRSQKTLPRQDFLHYRSTPTSI